MASSDQQSVAAPSIFDQMHAQAGGTPPQTIFDKLHEQAQQQQNPRVSGSSAPTREGSQDKSVSGFLGNVADSAGRFGNSLVDAGKLALGAAGAFGNVATLGIGRATGMLPEPDENEQRFRQVAGQIVSHPVDTGKSVVDYLAQRYGGFDKVKQTAYEDPVGFAADLSTVLGGGAGALKASAKIAQLAKLGRTADILSDIGNVASKASQATNPLNMPGKIVSAVGGGAMDKAAKTLYQGALKPSVTNGATDNAAITELGLRQRIPLNGKAAARGDQLARDTQAPINRLIANSPAQVDPNNVASIATSTFKPGLTNAANPGTAPATFDANVQDYLDKHTPPYGAGGQPLPAQRPIAQPYPIQEAQTEKVATYDKAANSYGKDAGVSPEQTATKALAYGLKTAMEQFIPELKGLNENEATALGLREALQKFTAKEANSGRLLQYLKPSIASGALAGAVGATEHSIPMALSAHLMTKALEDPGIQSRIAIALYKSANNPGTPYIRQIMTPAARMAEVQQHIQDAMAPEQGKGVSAPAPSVTAAPRHETAAPKAALPSIPPTAANAPVRNAVHPEMAELPSPSEAEQNADAHAQALVNHLTAVGEHVHQHGVLPPGVNPISPTQLAAATPVR